MNRTDLIWRVFIIYSCVNCTLFHPVKHCLFFSLSHTESWLPLKGEFKLKVKKPKWKKDVRGNGAIKREREIHYEAGERDTETGIYSTVCVCNYRSVCVFLASVLLLHVSYSNGIMCEQCWTLGLNLMDHSHSSGT